MVERVAPLAGLGGSPGSPEDNAWAVQRLLEAMAAARPVVLVVDDLHWAEPGLVHLLQGVCDWSRDAPILVAVFARPEFLDEQPGWGAGRVNGVTALLEPLGDDEVDALTVGLLDGRLPTEAADRVRDAAGGNPLFVEQLLAMLVEDGALRRDRARWVLGDVTELKIPPTIGALLTARLDRLSAGGEPFWARPRSSGRSSTAGRSSERPRHRPTRCPPTSVRWCVRVCSARPTPTCRARRHCGSATS